MEDSTILLYIIQSAVGEQFNRFGLLHHYNDCFGKKQADFLLKVAIQVGEFYHKLK
jgi:hypothetical protein